MREMVFRMDSFKWEHNRHRHRITFIQFQSPDAGRKLIFTWQPILDTYKEKKTSSYPWEEWNGPLLYHFLWGVCVFVWVCMCTCVSEHPRGRWEEKEALKKFCMTLNVPQMRKLLNRAPGAGSFLSENKDKAPDFIFVILGVLFDSNFAD